MTVTDIRPKPFSWSYSRLKNFESCAKRYYHLDIAKDVKQPPSEILEWGDLVHKSAANYLSKGLELPPGMPRLKLWCDRVLSSSTAQGDKLLVEQKLAITESLKPCAFFDSDAWVRTVIDVLSLSLAPPATALLMDWKTGKRLEDSVQLAIGAAVVFSHYPEVKKIRTEFIWLKEGENETSTENFTRADMDKLWHTLHPRLYALKRAHADNEFPATHNYLCEHYCPVRKCRFHGVSFR